MTFLCENVSSLLMIQWHRNFVENITKIKLTCPPFSPLLLSRLVCFCDAVFALEHVQISDPWDCVQE